ncbi:MAG: hypothetical protein CL489_08900 [Acidobacteria bacterium]|nr:hypothetical protein [Acidobacteriota bacterium]
MPQTKVVNVNRDQYDVYIGRGSIWGNPFRIGVDGTRKEVIDKYRIYLENNEKLLYHLQTLRGKRLGCYCKPKDCHGDVIVNTLNNVLGI